jgi:NAD(P)-dependent dehydrogenase (short-subunit alcohol dehydrogenase family)
MTIGTSTVRRGSSATPATDAWSRSAETAAVAAAAFVGGWAAYSALRGLWRLAGLGRRYDVAGKTVLITGGSRGLGLVLARELADRGVRLALCARDADELRAARDDLARRGSDALIIPCDVGDRLQVANMMAAIRKTLGPVQVLINNAGLIQVGPFETMTPEDFETSWAVHVRGPLNTILAVLPDMKAAGEGRIVNISSFGGKVAFPHMLPYCTGKFALTGLSSGLAAELAKDGIAVTTVCPGTVRTGSPRNADFKGDAPAEYAWFKRGDSIPVFSMSAELAARRIVEAMLDGRADLTLTPPARLAATLAPLMPETTAAVLAKVNEWLLPSVPGSGAKGQPVAAKGRDLPTDRPSLVTALTDHAAVANNQM